MSSSARLKKGGDAGGAKGDKAARRAAQAAFEAERLARQRAAEHDAEGRVLDVLIPFSPAFTRYDRHGLNAELFLAAPGPSGVAWSAAVSDFVFDLTRANMRTLYERAPGWGGWKDARKRAELADPAGRYIIVRERSAEGAGGVEADDAGGAVGGQGGAAVAGGAVAGAAIVGGSGAAESVAGGITSGGSPAASNEGAAGGAPPPSPPAPPPGALLGFVSFRFVLEGDYDVLYIYELQLSPLAQRRGVGKHLMQLAELVARRAGMQWVMLTVLKNNAGALDFYTRKMRYTVDASSPSACGQDDAAYEILSKCVHKAAVEAIDARVKELRR